MNYSSVMSKRKTSGLRARSEPKRLARPPTVSNQGSHAARSGGHSTADDKPNFTYVDRMNSGSFV